MTPKALISAIKETAPKPIFTHASNPQYLGTIHPSLVCVVCMDVLQSPVELPCNQYICASCCINSVRVSASTQCPCCYDCNLAENMPRKPPHVVCELLAGLLLECSECHTSVQANSYQAHLNGCTGGSRVVPDPPSCLTIREVLDAPADSSVTPLEVKAAGQVIQRMIHQEDSGHVIRVPTKGKVCTIIA